MNARQVIRIASLVLFASSSDAHHAVRDTYSADTLVNLSGTVSEVQWSNPHVLFVLETTDAAGEPAAWTVEVGNAPHLMERRGIPRDFIKPGDELRLEVWPAIDGTPRAHVRAIIFADGRRMDLPEDLWMGPVGAVPVPQ